MATSTPTKFNDYVNQLHRGKHDWSTHVFKVMLTNTPPSPSNSLKAELTEIAAGSGYTAGGFQVAMTVAMSGGVLSVSAAALTITASGGSIGPFRYAVLYNDSPATPLDPLIQFVDYGASATLADGESVAVKFNNQAPGLLFNAS